MKRGKIIVKQSLSSAYRQYLEDVTIPMNTYLDAPEEFVTTKPSIYHSIRMQPATDAMTGRVRNSPARARALSSPDNLQFQNDIRDFSLPLSTNQGLPLYGRHVYPGELYSFNPSFGKETHLPDLPVSYKQTWGDGTRNRPLNLYGFTGNAPTPQRFTSSTFQPEGIIYGDLDENDVIQLNTRPASAERFAQVARALSPFHPRRDIKHLGVHSEDLARDIMDAGIPPILAESNVDTKGIIHHLPFRIHDKVDVKEAHDPFAQYDIGNLNRPTPEGLGHFTLDSIRAGEPMDIAMQLLKEEIPYSSRDYPPQEISISTGNPLVTPKVAGQTPEVCNMPGCESGLPPVMYRRMANPIRSIDNHEFMCKECAYKHDLQSLLFDKMIKGEITPIEYAMQLLKQEPLQLRNSAELAELARQGDMEAYNEMMERTGDYYLANEITGEPDMEANLEAYGAETGKNPFKTPPIGRTNQIQIHQPPVTPIHADKKLHNWQYKNASEPMEIAMQLLKMPIISDSPEIKQLDTGPAHIHQFQDPVTGEVKPLYISPASNPDSENLYAGIVGDNGDRASAKFNTGGGDYASLDGVETQEPYRRRGYMTAIYDAMDEYLEQNKKGRRLVPSDFQSDEGKAFSESRKKSEPMEIAMQLLKERVSPEAKRHKLEYDKKYESSPERVKYREELNRERRRRHIMGRGGPDMSHTKDHTIVPESPHTNRARHFKDKGTLL